jgi:hypothetical protein
MESLTHDSAAADQAGAAAVKKERRDSLNVEGIHLHFAATNSRIRILATCQEETYYCEADRAIYDEYKGLIHLDGNVSVEHHKSTDVRRKPEAHRGGRIMVYPKKWNDQNRARMSRDHEDSPRPLTPPRGAAFSRSPLGLRRAPINAAPGFVGLFCVGALR